MHRKHGGNWRRRIFQKHPFLTRCWFREPETHSRSLVHTVEVALSPTALQWHHQCVCSGWFVTHWEGNNGRMVWFSIWTRLCREHRSSPFYHYRAFLPHPLKHGGLSTRLCFAAFPKRRPRLCHRCLSNKQLQNMRCFCLIVWVMNVFTENKFVL